MSQGSVASSTTSDLSTSANFLLANGFVSHPPSTQPHANAPAPAPPTLLSLRNERLSGGPRPATDVAVASSTAMSSEADIDSLSAAELRVAIVSIMQSKDEMASSLAEARRRCDEAAAETDRWRRDNVVLREAVDKLEKKVVEAEWNADSKCKFLQRENQLLKHQLKKYVGTVQSLQRQQSVDGLDPGGSAVDVAIEKLGIDGATGSGGSTAGDDVEQIRESYEQKLIQVSEMHSELMEFNDQLVMQVSSSR